jgi:integrase
MAVDRDGPGRRVLPRRQRGFHLFRHTWATWMRRYGGLDTSGLLETGAWRDRSSAARYEHLDATEEAQKADLLPVMKR